jgi:hypothetical protein
MRKQERTRWDSLKFFCRESRDGGQEQLGECHQELSVESSLPNLANESTIMCHRFRGGLN